MALPTGNLLAYIRQHPEFNQKNSINWFMRNVRDLGFAVGIGPMKMLGDNLSRQTSSPSIGRMFMFTYDPKYKKTLPYYDTFPLVMPFSMTDTHFTGINFHYLYPRERIVLLNHLLRFATDDTLNDRSKIMMSWELLKRAGETSTYSGAVKMYLMKQVKSRFVDVHPQDWISAIMLPTERFKNGQNAKVWLDTSRK